MSLILWLIDRPNVPNWLVVVGFLGPVTIAHGRRSAVPGARHRVSARSRSAQAAVGPDGKPIINPQTGQRDVGAGLQP